MNRYDRLKKELHKLEQKLDLNKQMQQKGWNYKFYKPVFIVGFSLFIIWAGWYIYAHDFDFSKKVYIRCDSDIPCLNPYKLCHGATAPFLDCSVFENAVCDDPLCNERYLPPHTAIGEPSNLPVFDIISYFALLFIINHLVNTFAHF